MSGKWIYANERGRVDKYACDVLILGGGLAGCNAAIAAARRGAKVILMEKGAAERSGSAGSGFDHWESACTNPCSKVTPEEIAEAYVHEQDEYSNGIGHYIECREGNDRLLDIERFGGKVRDNEGEFAGAPFRDDKTKLMFAYDYENKFTLRVWGSTFKPALVKECRRLGVKILDHTAAVELFTEVIEGKKRCTGAFGVDIRTAKGVAVSAKSTVLCMSRPARVWLFHSDLTGICEFRPMQSIGSGHAMGWRAGVEFTMMEKSVRGEFSSSGRSFPPYGTGNNHNTWYAATMVDATGREIPYVDRDGKELKTVLERYLPAPGQKFFLKGGVIDNPKYEYRGPETLPFDELIRRGYKLPFYADLSRMPEYERRVIWGMMVGEEGKTKIPILKNYTERGFDPEKHMLQSYGTGWQSAAFLDQERQLFGAPGGIITDWDLKTNLDGLYAAGDQLFASDCCGHACATGYYAGRKAAASAKMVENVEKDDTFLLSLEEQFTAPLTRKDGMNWRELNFAISKAMQNYCGGVKNDDLLREGLDLLDSYEREYLPQISCANPHELARAQEVADILTVSKMILNACLLRKCSSKPLYFERSDSVDAVREEENGFITIRYADGEVKKGMIPHGYFGDLKTEYEARNADYIAAEDARTVTESAYAHTESVKCTLVPESIGSASDEQYEAHPVFSSARPITIDAEKCIGCNRCADICQVDILMHNEQKGKPPVMLYPGECWYCGCCVMVCPKDAIRLDHPLINRAKFKEIIRPEEQL